MKKILLITLLIFINLITTAQNKNPEAYLPMAVENAQWTIFESDDNNLPPFNEHYYGYRIEGDTIINGTSYKKVYQRDFASVNPDLGNPLVGPFIPANEHLFGVIRDDIPNKRVYGIQFCTDSFGLPNSCVCDEEYLMYDFNMNVGDNYLYETYCLNESFGSFVGELHIEVLFNNERLVQQIYDNSGDTFLLRVIEGVGGSFGPFETLVIRLGCPCVGLDNYCIGTDQECLNGFILGDNEIVLNNAIKIYPNPVKNKLTIENPQETNYQIKIYDILGKLILTKQLSNTINTIDISNFKKGIYLLKQNNTLHKIIKQ